MNYLGYFSQKLTLTKSVSWVIFICLFCLFTVSIFAINTSNKVVFEYDGKVMINSENKNLCNCNSCVNERNIHWENEILKLAGNKKGSN